MFEYSAATANATNKITATPYSEDATLTIKVNDVEIDNEESASWESGENELAVTVEKGDYTNTYTVAVTYTPPSPPGE